jgi:WD40 repeat protein
MKKSIFLILILLSVSLKSQEYEIAWQKDMPQMSYAQFSKDGQFIYCAIVNYVNHSIGNEIWKYRTDNGEFVSKFDNTKVPEIYSMKISSSGNYIVTGDGGGGSNIWDVKAEKAVFQYTYMMYTDFLNDSLVLTIKNNGGESRRIVLVNFWTGKEIKSAISSIWQGHIKVSHNGKMFATASISGSIYYLTLWDTETLTEIKRFQIENFTKYTEFKDIKFSWDDKFVGVRTLDPHHVNIFDITNLSLLINSNEITPLGCGTFDFTGNNQNILFTYNNFNSDDYNTFIVDRISLKLKENKKVFSYPLNTSSNNLIFTGKALLKPKTVGIPELKIQNSEIIISPNPASDYIEISYSPSIKRGLGGVSSSVITANAGISIEIFNVFGMKITTPSNLAGLTPLLAKDRIIQIDVSNLPLGVYFIRIGDKFEKFIKI